MTLDVLQPRDTPTVCRLLRTKTFFGTYTSTGTNWEFGDSSTAVYWCLGTMANAGPDDAFAHPHACHPSRPCFRAQDE